MYTLFPYADITYDKDNKHIRVLIKLLSENNNKEITMTIPLTEELISMLDELS